MFLVFVFILVVKMDWVIFGFKMIGVVLVKMIVNNVVFGLGVIVDFV